MALITELLRISCLSRIDRADVIEITNVPERSPLSIIDAVTGAIPVYSTSIL
jgi:hypothetical protein